ncbi:MAG: ATP synthase subunit I [Candidatus Ozemobacteraceae bacterium]
MISPLLLVLSILAGAGAACFFFGGLWLTLQKKFQPQGIPEAFVKNFLFRLAVANVILLLVCQNSGPAWFVAIGTFWVTRMIICTYVAG